MKSKSSARFTAARPQTKMLKAMPNAEGSLMNGISAPNSDITIDTRYSAITPRVAKMTLRRNRSVTLMIREL